MFGIFSSLLSKAVKKADPAVAADDPTWVPTPKQKVDGAMHPLVREKLSRPPVAARALGVGIVYDPEGRPKITRDWLDHLSPGERVAVDANLAAHGWKITPDLQITKA